MSEVLIILIAVVVIAVVAVLVMRLTAAGKARAQGTTTGDEGEQPPGRVGRVR
jgi:archaellin